MEKNIITIKDIEKEILECQEIEKVNRVEVGAAWIKS
jgi:hypothetical protein